MLRIGVLPSRTAAAGRLCPLPARAGRGRRAAESVRPPHLEHGLRPDFKIVAPAAGADDRTRQRGLVDAVLDHGLVDVDGDDLAEGEPGLHLRAIGALQLDDHTLTRLLGAAVSPEILNSLTSWATWAAVAFICCAKSMVARFQTNSPVSWMLATLSFQEVEENPMIGGV